MLLRPGFCDVQVGSRNRACRGGPVYGPGLRSAMLNKEPQGKVCVPVSHFIDDSAWGETGPNKLISGPDSGTEVAVRSCRLRCIE